jgi:hypothetical protein
MFRFPFDVSSKENWPVRPDRLFYDDFQFTFLVKVYPMWDHRKFASIKIFMKNINENTAVYVGYPAPEKLHMPLRKSFLYLQFTKDAELSNIYSKIGSDDLFNFFLQDRNHVIFGSDKSWGLHYCSGHRIYTVGAESESAIESVKESFGISGHLPEEYFDYVWDLNREVNNERDLEQLRGLRAISARIWREKKETGGRAS